MAATLGFGKRRLVNEIIKNTWGDVDLKNFKFGANDLLYIMQEMLDEEGKKHLTNTSMLRGHHVFRKFVEHLLYRNLANFDSMVLITSEKGCVTDDCLIQTEDYPKGISIKKLINKGPVKVYSYNSKTKQIELKQSDGVMFAKYAETCELILKSGHKLKATLDHPVVLEDGTKKQIQNLCNNDNILYVEDSVVKISQKISIKLLGKQNVYDVVNVENNHNFICNSIVTKNTGKSSAAIMIARFWCKLIGIRFDPKRHLAYTNQDVIEKIDMLNAFEPLVCLEGNTKIRIQKNGINSINKIKNLINMKNYKVLSYNMGTKKYEYKTPEKTIQTSSQEIIYEIELENGKKIRATDNHMFLTQTGYKKLKDLTDDEIKIYKGYNKIKSIKKCFKRTAVYDIIGVSNNHNFIANDMVVHNCDESIKFACVNSNTNIQTKKGNYKIKDLVGKKNFEVMSWNKSKQKTEWKQAEKCIKTKTDYVYEIETICGKKISATKEHLFLLKNGAWKRLDELKEGDDLVDI